MKDVKEMVAKLVRIEQEIYKDKVSLNLFALLLREGEDKWDLLVSSAWIDRNVYDSLKYIASKLQKELNQEELLEISGIVVIDDIHIIDDINRSIGKYPHGVRYPYGEEIINYNLSGTIIQHGYVLTSHNSVRQSSLAAC